MVLRSALLAFLSAAVCAATESVRVADVALWIDLEEGGRGAVVRGTLRIEAAPDAVAAVQGLRIELTDTAGRSLLAQPLVTAASVRDFSLRVTDAPRWSAEEPELVTLTISVLDAGRTTQATKTLAIGIRNVAHADGRIYLNGAPIRLRGAVVPPGMHAAAEREAYVLGLKRANANALFVPATGNPADWLSLGDRLGLYVVTEAPASAEWGLHPSFLFPAESATIVADPATMQAFLRSGARLEGFARPTLVNAVLDALADRPVLAIDLAPESGDLSFFWQEIYWHPRLLGAFLAPSVDAFAAEVKKAYQPVLIERRRLKPGDVAVRVTNRHHHRSLEAFEPRWAVLRDGVAVQQGVLPPLALAPNAQPEVALPVAPIEAPVAGAAYRLRLSFHTRTASAWAPAGHEIAHEELPLDVAVPVPSTR